MAQMRSANAHHQAGAEQPHDQKRTNLLEMGDGLHLARETHACAARPATGVPETMFSSWRLFSEDLPTADIPGIMMRLGARHLNV
jgi:hypothetical protein